MYASTEKEMEVTNTPLKSHTLETERSELVAEEETYMEMKNSTESITNIDDLNKSKVHYFKCASCQTFHESWNFFLHLFEKHRRYFCLYCKRLFSTAEKLSVHLEIKHDLEQNHYNSEDALRQDTVQIDNHTDYSDDNTKYLMCCTCQHVFVEEEPFSNHDCNNYMQPCPLCGQMGRHSNNCKAHPDATRRNKYNSNLPQKALPPHISTTTQINNISATSATNCDNETTTTDINESSEYSNELQKQQLSIYENNATAPTSVTATVTQSIYDLNGLPTIQQQQQQQIHEEKEVDDNKPKLVVPKFKLRVPKEFQKSVDAVITSSEDSVNEDESETESEEEVEEEDAAEEQDSEVDVELNSSKEAEQEPDHTNNQNLLDTLNNSEDMNTSDTQPENNPNSLLEKSENVTTATATVQLAPNENETTEKIANGLSEQWTPTPPASPSNERHSDTPAIIGPSESLVSEEPNVDAIPIVSLPNSTEPSKSINELFECRKTPETTNENDLNQEQHSEEIKEALQTMATEKKDDDAKHTETTEIEESSTVPPLSPKVDVETANEDILPIEMKLARPLDEYETVEFIRLCLKYSYPLCLYCNHAKRIAVNAHSLVMHMLEQHRYTAVVESITPEEIQAKTILEKLQSLLPDLETAYINGSNFNSLAAKDQSEGDNEKIDVNERIYECFMCRFVANTHKELYLHNRKMHLRSAVLCFMCRVTFVSFSEVLCHVCPGVAHKSSILDIKYRCCLCNISEIPSSFRLMVHLRKRHNSCDFCLEDCQDQLRLSSHVWKHKLRHYCYHCNVAYRNKSDITKHLYWKHGTESINCKGCMMKRWRHVYHFCTAPANFVCESCNMSFSKAVYLTVHQRLHTDNYKHACDFEGCEEKFVSRRLLFKHKQNIHEVSKQIEEPDIKTDTRESNENLGLQTEGETLEKAENLETNSQSNEEDAKLDGDEIKEEKNEKIEKVIENEEQMTNGSENQDKRKQFLTLQALNLSESSDSSDSSDNSDNEESMVKIAKKTEIINTVNSDKIDKADIVEDEQKKEENAEKALEIWKKFMEFQDSKKQGDGVNEENTVKEADYTEENYPAPQRLHVAMSDHDYCRLIDPREKKTKKEKKEDKESKSVTPPPIEQIQLTLPSPQTKHVDLKDLLSSDSSSDESGCSCGTNCSCSSSDSDSNSSNSNSSDSDSTCSNKSLAQKKTNLNRAKESNKSPHKKHNKHDAVKSALEAEKAEEIVVAEAETAKAVQFCESDLETSESETDEEFYDQHPQRAAHELLLRQRAQILPQTSALNSPTNNYNMYTNGDTADNNHENDADAAGMNSCEKKERKKIKKKKRDKRIHNNNNININNSNNNNRLNPIFDMHNATLNNIINETQNNNLYNSFSTATIDQSITETFPAQMMPFAAEQTVITNVAHIFSEGGGSSSEADGPLKRSKRTRRPNKFYGYTSEDETMSSSMGQSLMIGMRSYKPQPPPQLTWNKDDLPTPSKSILNNKTPKPVKTITKSVRNNLENAFNEFADLVNQDSRKRTFGIAAGGKVGRADNTFYKRAAKKTNVKLRKVSSAEEESNYLPPIPRLKIKPARLGLNVSNLSNNSGEQFSEKPTEASSSSSSSSSSEDEGNDNQQAITETDTVQRNTTTAAEAMTETQNINQSCVTNTALNVINTPTPKATAFNHSIPPALLPNPDFATLQYFKINNIRYPIRPPAGARQAREGESVYCYCRCPYDEVSEMIACDGEHCLIEWFHFECVGIMMAPVGKWYCAECRQKILPKAT